jgi:hypothetical protein
MPHFQKLAGTPFFFQEMDAQKALDIAYHAVLPALLLAKDPVIITDFDETLCDNAQNGQCFPCVNFLHRTEQSRLLEKTCVVLTARNDVPATHNYLSMWLKTNKITPRKLITRPANVFLKKEHLMAWKYEERQRIVAAHNVVLIMGDQWGDVIFAPEYTQAPLPKKGRAFWVSESESCTGPVRLVVNFKN